MMTLLTAFHPAHDFWIGLLIVLAIIALMNLICCRLKNGHQSIQPKAIPN